MHNTFRSIKSDSPPCLPASWSSLEEFGDFEDCMAFYIKIDNADPMLLLDLDQTPAKYLHLSRVVDLFQFSISTQTILFSSQVQSHYARQTHFNQFLKLLLIH